MSIKDNSIILLVFIVVISFTSACDNNSVKDSSDLNNPKEIINMNDSVIPEISDTIIQFEENVSPEKRKEIMDRISKKYLMGKFDPSKDDRFTLIPSPYAEKEMYMRIEALESFKRMHAHANKDNIRLVIKSATRPFDVQKSIWEAKWTGKRKVDGEMLSKEVKDPKARAIKILRWSSMPSTSRHHWGTDIDLNNLEPEYFASGQGLKEYEWLVANAHEYGFCQVYSEMGEDRPFGYQEEKWHWSYLPVSKPLTEAYAQKIVDGDIQGFMGAESAPMIEVVKKYVLGINSDCL
ncbi:MAG: M15 family metallopeptidase [Saprospiraceae bacterium]|nr:M15 family metallopeptidase [Saprospiraceae bacterium]